MEVGILNMEEDKEKVKKELESGKAIPGIGAESLLNTIIYYEVTGRTDRQVINELKKELMILTGKLKLKEEEEEGEEEEQSEATEKPEEVDDNGTQG